MTDIRSILERLDEERIFCVQPIPGGLNLQESCDGYFSHDLTAAEVRQLAADLIAVAESIPAQES